MPDLEHRQTPDLLAEALVLSQADPESDARMQVIRELHRRGTEDIFLAANDLGLQADSTARCLAAEILGQLGPLDYVGNEQLRPFTTLSIPILRRMLEDLDDRVIAAATAAIGHHYRNSVIAEVPSLALHPSVRVRLSAAQNLHPGRVGSGDSLAIGMLIRLSEDEDERVRDWATFRLGSIDGVDTLEVREALYPRLNDTDFDTRSEAMIALAERGDRRVIPFIAAALASDSVGRLSVEAAGAIGTADLLEPLLELRSWWDVDSELLEDSISKCGGKQAV